MTVAVAVRRMRLKNCVVGDRMRPEAIHCETPAR